MKILTHIARLVVAIVFIYSGFVKLVDPIGSQIKFEEYFREDVLNLPFLIPYALPFAILLIFVELMIGVKLLVGFKPKITVWAANLLMIVFFFLTLYSAVTGKVTDCGCFGDALKLSPWATFYKNVVFLALTIFLLFKVKHITPWLGKKLALWIPFITFIGSLYITYYVLKHIPIIDFRPYKVGANIMEGMNQFDHEGIPVIHDFVLYNDEDDLTESILASDKVLLVVAYDLTKSDSEAMQKIKEITEKALAKGYTIYALSASDMRSFDTLKEQHNWNFDMLYADETMLKTMIRANPGYITLTKGTITGKWNGRDAERVSLD
jgi:uncharacterized membrane protein YphA (DoxX/SURF4 family)